MGHSVCRPDGRVLAGGFKTREAAVSAAVELIYGLKQPSDFEDAEAPTPPKPLGADEGEHTPRGRA